MKKRLLLLAITIVLGNLSSIKAQTPTDMIAAFFKTYQKNDPTKALDDLYATSPWLSRSSDNVAKLKSQFKDLKDLVGEYNDHILLYDKDVKGCFVITSYLVKFDRQPVRFNFEFYKAKDKWALYSFSYDDNFDDDLENAVKIELLELMK